MRIAIVAWIVLLSVSVVGCERWELDQRMEDLCKTDGGIRVFETVRLPPEMFDQSGDPFPGWRQRPAENRLSDDFWLIDETSYLKRGDPLKGEGELRRTHWKIIRKSDAKVLGEGTRYGRSGGDLVAVGHFTSKSCPSDLASSNAVIRAVFVKEGR